MIRTDVAIVGGGFSGTMVAAHLARHLDDASSVTVFEPERLGCGAAYGTPHRQHLLNTRARAMSAFDSDPDHFVRWLGPRVHPDDFVSRALYGTYLNEIAQRALERPRFAHVADSVRSISNDGSAFRIETERGAAFEARLLVLATGTTLPSDDFLPPSVKNRPGYVRDPWHFDYGIVGGHVLLVGSGLTALDALVALDASGHRGGVHVVSRHGRFPEVHEATPLPYDVVPALDPSSAGSLLRGFRTHAAVAQSRGFWWHAVVDALRPESEALWRRLPPVERARFDRHLRARWQRVRHRAPQAVDAARERYASDGKLTVFAGTLIDSNGGDVAVRTRGGVVHRLRPDWIFNCTGIGRSQTFGFDANDCAENLWLTGALLRDRRFESTAVPELRKIAEQVASDVTRALR